MSNKTIEREPLTAVFHAYDAEASHKGEKVLENFEQWIGFMYVD